MQLTLFRVDQRRQALEHGRRLANGGGMLEVNRHLSEAVKYGHSERAAGYRLAIFERPYPQPSADPRLRDLPF